MATPELIELTAEVVASFVSNNPLPRTELPALIQAVHSAVDRLGRGSESAPPLVVPHRDYDSLSEGSG